MLVIINLSVFSKSIINHDFHVFSTKNGTNSHDENDVSGDDDVTMTPVKEKLAKLDNNSGNNSNNSSASKMDLDDQPRRSSRRRAEKSYVETPDLVIEQENLAAAAAAKALLASSGLSPNSAGVKADGTVGTVVHNGDIEMESENEEDEESAPVSDMKQPKV